MSTDERCEKGDCRCWGPDARCCDCGTALICWGESARLCDCGTRLTRETDEERDTRFAPHNDQVWGAGNWIRCDQCPPDTTGRQVYHHRKAHQ